MERGPIYVAGLERSGTSLMYALLASHPDVAMTRRTNLWRHFYGQYGDLAEDANLERCLATMRVYKRLVVLDPDWDAIRAAFLAGERTYPRLFAAIEEGFAARVGRPRWGDKSLHTERYADEIVAAYPGVRILHMLRDPRDRFASSFTRWKVRRGGVGAGAAEWLGSARIAMRNERKHPEHCRVVRYETLASQPEATLRELCAFLDAPYAAVMLRMDGAPSVRDGGNSSYGKGEAGVISTRSIGRYVDVLSPRQIAYIQMVAGDQMRRFGYELTPIQLPVGQRLTYTLRDVPLESAHLLAWRTRESFRDRAGRPLPEYRKVKEPAG
ncbi:MAG: sulfotransferase family protein [Actinomycetota bacterium]